MEYSNKILVNGELPRFAWPGGYNLIYIINGCEAVCYDCACHVLEEMKEDGDDAIDKLTDYDTHDEGTHYCGCGETMLGSYCEEECGCGDCDHYIDEA